MQQTLGISDYKSRRSYIPKDFEITDWESLKPYVDFLLSQEPASVEELEAFLYQVNELDAIVQEELAWRYIRMTCNTQDESLVERYQYFIQEILPHISIFEDALNRKLVANPYFDQLDPARYQTYIRSVKKDIELFREENIPLLTEDQTIAQQYSALTSVMSIEHEGKTLTFQQAGKLMESQDRQLRKAIWEKVWARRTQDADKLEDIFDQLVAIRHQVGQNAGFDTYTAYKFLSRGRFDYSQEDTLAFHDAVEKAVRPVYEAIMQERKQRLGLDELRPWDLNVGMFGDTPLRPFTGADELVSKTISLLSALRPELGEMIALMDRMGYLDLESRVGKAPGGYNYPLMEVGVPFIFMNATGTQSDVTTMLHESGHAIHAFLTLDIGLNVLKNTPSEVAELAAMSMELLSLDHYGIFYPDQAERLRAQKEQLMRCLIILPWIATVDAFQQWVYDHPHHSREQRSHKWLELHRRFHGDVVNWEGYEPYKAGLWLKQGHIFDVPFYYIEYAIAQLGAIAIWRNFRQDPQQGLEGYLNALRLGYTRPIPQIYETAHIRFDFSETYIRECMQFCLEAYHDLKV